MGRITILYLIYIYCFFVVCRRNNTVIFKPYTLALDASSVNMEKFQIKYYALKHNRYNYAIITCHDNHDFIKIRTVCGEWCQTSYNQSAKTYGEGQLAPSSSYFFFVINISYKKTWNVY